ncbi:MAG TPA: phosphatase PAP2 family protein, partial [Terriglobales bacterium]|nr:phosphatase PAP2 family protein [Terriglobales bacterium]
MFWPKRLLQDQKTLWTSPLRIKGQDLPLVIGFATGTAALTQADPDIATKLGSRRVSLGQHASDAGVALFGGAAASFFLSGVLRDNAHARETGQLIGEAAGNALIVNTALQNVFRRARPDDPRSGSFFVGGTSFPSNHTAVAWAAAAVVANEYPGWGTRILSYGLASAVSAGRVAGRKHFTTDVLVGSALGWMVGREMYRLHHDPGLNGASWDSFDENRAPRLRAPDEFGSPYVPLDSWVYAAFDRLQAMGYAPSGFANMRPWTRMECARLLDEMSEPLSDTADQQSEPYQVYSRLKSEFASDLRRFSGETQPELQLDSIYTRYTAIAGPPLRDGYHFGQTLINDYGRPYGRGSNVVSG